MPIKVLQLINSFTTGGAELMVKRLALGYDPKRVRSDVWSLCRNPSQEGERIFLNGLDSSGISYHCLNKRPGLKDPRIFAHLVSHLRRERYDIIHTHCYSPGLYGRLAASLVPGRRRMVTIHDRMTSKDVRREQLLSKVTEFYVACSSEIFTDLRDRCRFPDSKFIRILNGIGEDRTRNVKASRDEIRHKYGVQPEEQVALVLGRIDPQKAQLDILEALSHGSSQLGKLKIWMVGNDQVRPEYSRKVRRAIQEKGFESRVNLYGVVEDSEVDQMMKGADLFLLPSEREGLSVAILEALGAGLPTVISDLETNREVSENGRVAWLTPPHAPKVLAQTLKEILADRDAMKTRGVKAAEYVRAKFGFTRVIEEYTNAYEALVS